MRRTALLLALALCGSLLPSACGGGATASAAGPPALEAQAATSHPRLLVTRDDLPRLRSWASASNPMYARGLARNAATARRAMNRGLVPGGDGGGPSYEQYPTELYAELFAFMSLVHPSPAARADYGRRARRLLMYVIHRAERGPAAGAPFRDPLFSTGDRSRWQGEAYALTVDWAYPYFSRADKRAVRKVFLRWSREQYKGYPLVLLTGAKPSRRVALGDPALVASTTNVRWSLNNYYIAHARNLGLMSMALDAGDDPGGALRAGTQRVTGTFLYVIDSALRTQAPGGLLPEGFEYGPDSLGRLAQLMVAMRTAGASPPGAGIAGNPVWADALSAYLHSLPPVPTQASRVRADLGQIWQAASFGDEESYWALEPISLFGPLGIEAAARGDATTLNAVRWIATNVPPGGAAALVARAGDTPDFFASIMYFLTFAPGDPAPTDPRPALDLDFVAPGLNRTIARTCWCDTARMFTHKLSFSAIDHQVGDGNDFGFLRNGEWLTKQRAGYDSQQTEALNIVTIGNDRPFHRTPGSYPWDIWKRGGQWILVPSGDPTLVSRSLGDGYVEITGDATALYNSDDEGVRGVRHASRSIVWLEPDHIVVYDRVTTATAGRFKRFWLQTPAAPVISGRLATVVTPKGQRLFSTTLLPENATLSASRHGPTLGTPAVAEPMRHRLRVEATGAPADVRFLHVIQGADAGATLTPSQVVRSSGGTPYEGALVGDTAVMFPVGLQGGATTIALPAGARRVLVTGLTAGAGYRATAAGGTLTVSEGGGTAADEGGSLMVTL